MELEELIARLEKATGPDRELDKAIALKVGWRTNGVVWAEPGERFSCGALAPGFTSSLDAALTLVPEGHYANIDTVGVCYVHKAGVKSVHHYGEHRDDCVPIALCIAALKAASLPQHKEGERK